MNTLNGLNRLANRKPTINELELFLQFFQGRENVFAKQWGEGMGYSPVRPERPINIDDIQSHLQGTETYGIYPIKIDNTIKLICFDIDLPKNFAEINEEDLVINKSILLQQVKDICDTISNLFLKYHINEKNFLIEDTGGRGYHIWLFFANPLNARVAREFAYFIIEESKVQCEVFPKQNEVTEGNYGNLIKLPLGFHKKYKQYSSFIDIKGQKVLKIDKPFEHLVEIFAIPESLIKEIVNEKIRKKQLKYSNLKKEDKTNNATYSNTIQGEQKKPLIGNLIEKCKALLKLKEKVLNQHHLEHEERLALAYILINTRDGVKILHQLLSNCSDYNMDRTQKEIDYLVTRKMKPISCRRLIEQGICKKYCRSEIREQSLDINQPEPSPIRFALWQRIVEPESLWEADYLSFANVYNKSNLYRAWEQVKEHVKVFEAFYDINAFEYFEEHLEENIETIRFELRNNLYSPSPYRWYSVPKKKNRDDFEYRRMAFVNPRDYVVIQAVINIIGSVFEKSFSDSCLSYRLDTTGRTGNSIYYSWQSSWQNRKKRVMSFLNHPESFYYIKADITRFYDNIDRVRLYKLILEKISAFPEISTIIKSFLENSYVEDLDGKELNVKPPSKGIPQGPAFSAFFANIYLDELDHLIEKYSYDYIRYVDDIVILNENIDQAEKTKRIFEEYLDSIGLELNPDKTEPPCSVVKKGIMLDFLGEMKYGMAGLFIQDSYNEQLISPYLLKIKLDELIGIDRLTEYNLEEITTHLSYYLRMQDKIKIRLNELAINISRKVLEEYVLKPHHLTVVLQVLIKNKVDLTSSIKGHKSPYIKIILCLLMITKIRDIPQWFRLLLVDFIQDRSSYILRGTAYLVISRFCNSEFFQDISKIIEKEESLYVIERSLSYLVEIKNNDAKMSFLNLVEKHFNSIFDVFINTSIKFKDQQIERLIKNRLKGIDRLDLKDYYILLEFVILICPEDFEELLIKIFSKKDIPLIRQLAIFSLSNIEEVVSNRGELMFAHKLLVKDRIDRLESEWLRNILQRALQEWGINEIKQLTSVYNWLSDGDQSKECEKIQDLSSKVHKRQGGYKSWIIKDQLTDDLFILEAIEESILEESNFLNSRISEQNIKNMKEVLEMKNLSYFSDFFISIEGGKKYFWFKYAIPENYDVLYNFLNNNKINKKFNELEILNIVISLFRQVELIKECIGIEPVVNPNTVIIGPGNQVQLINLFFGIPRKLYISIDRQSLVDNSNTTNSLFNALLSYELLSIKCPINIFNELKTKVETQVHYISDCLKELTVSLHFIWILDRLGNPTNPQNRYNKLNTLEKDVECFRKFKDHFEDQKLLNLPTKWKSWAELLNVLNLRITRFLNLPYKRHDSIHEISNDVFNIVVYSLTKKTESTIGDDFGVMFTEISKDFMSRIGIKSMLHESSYKCGLFATGILNKFAFISKMTQWKMSELASYIIFYISLKIELIAIAMAIGLFDICEKDKIKTHILELCSIQNLANKFEIKHAINNNLLTETDIPKISDLMHLIINKNFQEAIRINGSNLFQLILIVFIFLKDEKELWERWHKSIGLSSKIDFNKAISCLESVCKNSIEIEKILDEFIKDPVNARSEEGDKLIDMYNLCLRDIFEFRKIMKIKRKRTFLEKDYHPIFDENNVVVRFDRKTEKFLRERIISFPQYNSMMWKNAAITIDFTKSGKNIFIKSLSMTPSKLMNITGWEYKNFFKRLKNIIRRYSKKFLWKSILVILFVASVILLLMGNFTIAGILITLSIGLSSPYIEKLYQKL